MNTLQPLAEEYLQSAELISQMIRHGNQLMRQARAEKDQSRMHALRLRQRDLYMQREHLLDVATHLKFYYAHSSAERIE